MKEIEQLFINGDPQLMMELSATQASKERVQPQQFACAAKLLQKAAADGRLSGSAMPAAITDLEDASYRIFCSQVQHDVASMSVWSSKCQHLEGAMYWQKKDWQTKQDRGDPTKTYPQMAEDLVLPVCDCPIPADQRTSFFETMCQSLYACDCGSHIMRRMSKSPLIA